MQNTQDDFFPPQPAKAAMGSCARVKDRFRRPVGSDLGRWLASPERVPPHPAAEVGDTPAARRRLFSIGGNLVGRPEAGSAIATRASAVAFAVFAFIGCSGTGTPSLPVTDGGVMVYPVSQTARDYVESFCTIAADCCGQLAYIGNKGDSAMSSCRERLLPLAPAFDPAMGAACLEQLRDNRLRDDSCLPISLDPRDPCALAFSANPGHQPVRGKCTSHLDCARPQGGIAICAAPDAPGGGQCQALIWGKEGQKACGSVSLPNGFVSYGNVEQFPTSYVCVYFDGIYCDMTTHVCVNQHPDGQACQSDSECVSASCGSSNTCDLPGNAGGPCTELCVPGYYCKDSQCAPLLAPGNPCFEARSCTSGHCDNGMCSMGATEASVFCGG
jgi:hypothetical protein